MIQLNEKKLYFYVFTDITDGHTIFLDQLWCLPNLKKVEFKTIPGCKKKSQGVKWISVVILTLRDKDRAPKNSNSNWKKQ